MASGRDHNHSPAVLTFSSELVPSKQIVLLRWITLVSPPSSRRQAPSQSTSSFDKLHQKLLPQFPFTSPHAKQYASSRVPQHKGFVNKAREGTQTTPYIKLRNTDRLPDQTLTPSSLSFSYAALSVFENLLITELCARQTVYGSIFKHGHHMAIEAHSLIKRFALWQESRLCSLLSGAEPAFRR